MTERDRLDLVNGWYEAAVFGGDDEAVAASDRELDAVEADLALARGRNTHARFLAERHRGEGRDDPAELASFERAAELYRRLGDVRGEGEASFWLGTYHQVVRDDAATAVPFFERARTLATDTGDRLTLSYALRHLGIAEHAAGRLDAARDLLTESTRLRRELGFRPGVAANLVGLAYLAAEQGQPELATQYIDEGIRLAEASDARAILAHLTHARTEITGT